VRPQHGGPQRGPHAGHLQRRRRPATAAAAICPSREDCVEHALVLSAEGGLGTVIRVDSIEPSDEAADEQPTHRAGAPLGSGDDRRGVEAVGAVPLAAGGAPPSPPQSSHSCSSSEPHPPASHFISLALSLMEKKTKILFIFDPMATAAKARLKK
jgi:hypothetical protein